MFGFMIILLAALVQGITGFGFALIAVPLLSLFIPEIKSITPIIVGYSLVTNILIFCKSKNHVKLKEIMPLIIFGIIGTPIGTYILLFVNAKILKLTIGLIICVTATAMLKNYKIRIKNEKLSYGLVGILSGLLNGSIGLSGPPVVLFMTNQGIKKETFRANLSIYGIVTNIFALTTFILGGIINNTVVIYAINFFPALLIGSIIGIKFSTIISEKVFKKTTIYLITILGLYTVIATLFR